MCPSNKKIEKGLFDEIKKASEKKIVHLLIAVSGLWIISHQEEFYYLKSLISETLKITWVNHSFSHAI
ncbi:MAG: hypothetical protein ACI8ZF_000717 [Candidatus Midichloriaceae bacterium]|jgi:hypothetical protein